MKQYKITKIIYSKNISVALKNEPQAEVVAIELNEPVENLQENKFGF